MPDGVIYTACGDRRASVCPACELGSAYHASHADTQRKARGHIRQLEALGYTITLTQAA